MPAMTIFRRCLFAFCCTILLTAGCEHADPLDPNQIEPTLSSIQTNIFDLNCALSGCHAGPNPQLGLDLSAGQARANMVGVPSVQRGTVLRIAPGDPDASYLVWKIEGRPEIGGQRMPRGRAPLAQAQIDLVRQWIAAGALDN